MEPPRQSEMAGDDRLVQAVASLSRRLPPVRGKANLARRLMRRAERRGELHGGWRTRLKDGSQLTLPKPSSMSWVVAFQGLYDDAAVRYVARFIMPGTIVLDVGASLGLWTVQLGKIAAARGAEVWTFEPNPANTRWIEENVRRNGLSDVVTTHELGLGDKPEQVTLVSAEYGIGNGAIGLEPQTATGKVVNIAISVSRLDDLDLARPVSFIKIDTEGYEVAFLRGAAQLLRRDRPVIFGEFSAAWLKQRGEDLHAALADLDYDVATLVPRRSRSWRSVDHVEAVPVDLGAPGPLPEDLLLCPR